MKNQELSHCTDCGAVSTATLDGGDDAFCGACGSYALSDLSDGMKFVPEFEGEYP